MNSLPEAGLALVKGTITGSGELRTLLAALKWNLALQTAFSMRPLRSCKWTTFLSAPHLLVRAKRAWCAFYNILLRHSPELEAGTLAKVSKMHRLARVLARVWFNGNCAAHMCFVTWEVKLNQQLFWRLVETAKWKQYCLKEMSNAKSTEWIVHGLAFDVIWGEWYPCPRSKANRWPAGVANYGLVLKTTPSCWEEHLQVNTSAEEPFASQDQH